MPKAYWTAAARNAYFTRPDEVSFYDPSFPAWFTLRFDLETGRVLTLEMVATAHFMHHALLGASTGRSPSRRRPSR